LFQVQMLAARLHQQCLQQLLQQVVKQRQQQGLQLLAAATLQQWGWVSPPEQQPRQHQFSFKCPCGMR
jgi:hypothetical protein